MDISEALVHKSNTEAEIKAILNKFIQLTGLDVTYISAEFLTQEYIGQSLLTVCEKVELEVRL